MDYLDEQVGALDLNTSTDTILSEMGTMVHYILTE